MTTILTNRHVRSPSWPFRPFLPRVHAYGFQPKAFGTGGGYGSGPMRLGIASTQDEHHFFLLSLWVMRSMPLCEWVNSPGPVRYLRDTYISTQSEAMTTASGTGAASNSLFDSGGVPSRRGWPSREGLRPTLPTAIDPVSQAFGIKMARREIPSPWSPPPPLLLSERLLPAGAR